jgi:hypothetical protein
MKSRGLIAAVLVLGALSGALYWSNHRQPIDDAAKAAAGALPTILALNKDDISKIEIARKDGDDIVLSKDNSDQWKITAPKALPADQNQISTLLTALSPVNSDRMIDEKAGDLKQYGLAEPLVKVSATMKDGKPHSLVIGDDTPTGGSAYAALEGDQRVFVVSSFTKSSLNKSINDLRDKHLLPVDYDKVSRVELAGPKLDLSFASDNGQWVIQNPKDVRGDTSKLETIIDKLRAATMDPSAPDADMKKAAAAFGSGIPVTTVKVAGHNGSSAPGQELQVRKSKDGYYAKSSAMEGAYKIANDLGDAIASQSLDDYREKKLLNSTPDDPSKVDLQIASGKSYSLSRNGSDWVLGGKKMEFTSVETFLDSVRQSTSTKFVTTGFTTPAVTLTVTSGDGKRVEKVLISKNGSGYVAKRENEALLYELDAKTVDELEKSAEGMKPDSAPQK